MEATTHARSMEASSLQSSNLKSIGKFLVNTGKSKAVMTKARNQIKVKIQNKAQDKVRINIHMRMPVKI